MKGKTLYVSDMDGTLMGSDSRVSKATAAILNRLIDERGLLFTVATARTPATVVPLMSEVKTTLPYIVLAGAAMWDAQQGTFVDVQSIPHDTVRDISAIFEKHGLHPFIYRQHGNMIHAHHCGAMSQQEEGFVKERLNTPFKRFFLDNSHYATSDDQAMLIFSMNDYATLERIYNEVRATVDCSPMFYHDIFDPSVGLLEIYTSGCTKAGAIRRLAQRINADKIVAFGDNRNDIAMLQAADHAVAVENAFPEVKAVAHEVIGPNTADSVAHYIETS
ncbi:MAG: HAD family hydrolase [Bacteroidales bacterium]|nr:HAD family hydrolase [Candidatus Sodaliphilus limicaballi]